MGSLDPEYGRLQTDTPSIEQICVHQMKKIMLIFGTRPEAIKMAPLVKAFQSAPGLFELQVCVTAQHRDMLDQVLHLFEIRPDFDLNIMKNGQDLYDVTSRVLTGMGEVFKSAKTDIALVHGDTTTSMAAALAAFYQKIPVGHVEAGLRTNDIYSPWPEEMNRRITDSISTWHFAPTLQSKMNLLKEGMKEENIVVTGNTVIDALYWVIGKISATPQIEKVLESRLESFGIIPSLINAWRKKERKLVIVTCHRRENIGVGIINICQAIRDLAAIFQDVDFVYPVHPNPNVRNAVCQIFGDPSLVILTGKSDLNNVYLIEPLDYLPFVYLMNISYLVLTDSGGLQEEAPAIGKPVLVMRDTTERPEAVEAGTVKLVGTDKVTIIKNVSELIYNSHEYARMAAAGNPYGDGRAGEKIKSAIL
jgi:UDP-N-acetylglucosamine 2-epimerase (non-hydrolysing)